METLTHLSLQKPPEFLFYATDEDSVDQLMRQGLNGLLWLYETAEDARRSVRRVFPYFMIIVLANVMYEDGYTFARAESGEWTSRDIPIKYLRLQ